MVASAGRSSREPRPAFSPPGWPDAVRPPGSPGWEGTAAVFLLDCCPADFRAYPVLRRHPVVLARFAAVYVSAHQEASAGALGTLRTGLAGQVPPEAVQAAVDAWEEQAALLVRRRREVGLVEDALRGRTFVQRL